VATNKSETAMAVAKTLCIMDLVNECRLSNDNGAIQQGGRLSLRQI
jgi:hypothetical protein